LSSTTLLHFAKPVRLANFSPIEKAEAAAYAKTVYDRCFEAGAFDKKELGEYLLEMGLWTEEEEAVFTQGFDDIQQMKMDYYEAFALETRRNRIKGAIRAKTTILNNAFQKKSYLSEYTCEASRDEAYGFYLFKDRDCPFSFYRKLILSNLPEDDVRNLYFDQTWRMIWGVSKDPQAIFGTPLSHLNDNQLSLLYWSKLYDSISESMDAPSSSVMKDHIAIDGWLIKQAKKRETEDRKNALPSSDAGEVFVPITSKKEIKEVNNLNSPEGKQILKSRAKDLADKGTLDERQFSHVKQELNMKKNELSFRNK
jgi:hypothetical protein